jgi:hypothetical protein
MPMILELPPLKPLLLTIFLVIVAWCRAAPILPEEAKEHIGENVSVHGLVEEVAFSQKGDAFVNFGGKYPQQVFTGFVSMQNVDAVGGERFLLSLLGNAITITGKIELYKGRPEIMISSPAQIVK